MLVVLWVLGFVDFGFLWELLGGFGFVGGMVLGICLLCCVLCGVGII